MARSQITKPKTSIYEVRSGKLVTAFRWKVSYPANGVTAEKQGRVTVSRFLEGNTQAKAREAAREQAEQDAKSFVESLSEEPRKGPKALTVRDWLDFCDETIFPRLGRKARYCRNRRRTAELYFLPRFGHLQLADLADMAVEMVEWFDSLKGAFERVHRNRRGEVVKTVPYTLNLHTRLNIVGELSAYLSQAVKFGKLRHNPMAACQPSTVETRQYQAELRSSRKFLTIDEVRRFIAIAKEDPAYPVYLIQRDTGARISEACGLRISDVDLETGGMALQVQLTRLTGKGLVEDDEMKSAAGTRPALASPELLALVRERAEQERLKQALGQPTCPYVACRPTGEPFDSQWASKNFRKLCERAGIELPRGNASHALRRTVQEGMRQAGISDEARKLIAGHADIEVTNSHYSNLSGELKMELERASEHWVKKLTEAS